MTSKIFFPCFMIFLLLFNAFTPLTNTAQAKAADNKIVGYYPAWASYGREYQIDDIEFSKINVLNYAFFDICWQDKHGNGSEDPGNPSKTLFDCTVPNSSLQSGKVPDGSIVLGDPDADIGKTECKKLTTSCGNLGALAEKKKKNSHLVTLMSVGGWTWSNRFSDMAKDKKTRKTFIDSVVKAMDAYHFDGVDLDWEYPGQEAIKGNSFSPDDKKNFTLLLEEIRKRLDTLGKKDKKKYFLTIASGANQTYLDNIEPEKVAKATDWINIMAYDFHGSGWETTTNHNTALKSGTPETMSVDKAIEAYLAAKIPAKKIVLGVEFVGRGWEKCEPGPDKKAPGLHQTCTAGTNGSRTPKGTWDEGTSGTSGIYDYGDIVANLLTNKSYKRYYDKASDVPYLYNKSTGVFVSYEDEKSIGAKMDYISKKGLAGAMIWELSSDCRKSPQYNCSKPQLLDTVIKKLGKPGKLSDKTTKSSKDTEDENTTTTKSNTKSKKSSGKKDSGAKDEKDSDAWKKSTQYDKGSKVTYQDKNYVCTVPHMSLSDWPPNIAHGLWKLE